jgi:hypothetical protein
LGIDARVIVRAIEEHYGDVLVKAGINGYEYLDKIVQMPFVIPTATRADIGNYVESLIWTKAEKEMVEAKFAPKSEAAEKQAPKPGQPRKEEKPFVQEPAAASSTELVPVTFSEPERKALNKCAEDIVDNPRKIKRIVNIYRLVRLLLKPNFLEYQKIISWILLTEQWPLHASWILEEIVNDKFQNGNLSKTPNANILDVYNQVKDNIYSNEMDSLIAIDADPKVFYQFIQKEPILTIDEIYYHLYPLTFNLNPAIKFEISKYISKRAEDYVQTQIKQNLSNQSNAASVPEIKSAKLEKAIQDISDANK